jgi:hypothetical protein
LLAAAAFAAIGFVAVWQGFGLAGFGTDLHVRRAFVAVALLFAAGMPLVWPKMSVAGRVLAALVGIGAAGAAWWYVPHDPDFGRSLDDAVAERDQLKTAFAAPLLDDVKNAKMTDSSFNTLKRQYPVLFDCLSGEHKRWLETAERTLAEKYRQLPSDDIAAAQALNGQANALGELDKDTATRLQQESRAWLIRATQARIDELAKGQAGDWDVFTRTAPGRHAFAAAFPMMRSALVKAEEDWALRATAPDAASWPDQPYRVRLRGRETDLLGLKALDTTPGRFKEARRRLFELAHEDVKREVTKYLAAGRDDQVFGPTRAHAVEWNATATILGPEEVKKLDKLRATGEFFDKLAGKAARPTDPAEVAPEPRPKP